MKLSEAMPVIKAVILNPYVIGAAIAVIFYCNFMSYVARYKKKPPKPKKPKAVEAAPAPKPEGEKDAENEEAAEEE